jgi:nitroimidazol reductase NimA-like FMN-containing flavoprotein (pyridoxamine 5'-phosphate oxidase superfamily)
MRRADKEIRERELIEHVIAKAQVCRLGLCRDGLPYIVPLSFGYDGAYIYFHTASEGLKLDYLAANNRVCFELEHDVRVLENATDPCHWSFSYYSVIGFGLVEEILDPDGKAQALNQVMRHYSSRDWSLTAESVRSVRVWRIAIEQITGKQSKDKTTPR